MLDIDVKDSGLSTWNELLKEHEEPYTVKVKTGSGGLHYYFKYNEKLKLTSSSKVIKINNINIGIDIKTNGGYVIIPGS